jgi:hypothetical protein
MVRTIAYFLASVLLGACALDPTVPRLTTDGLPDGLEVSLTVAPDEVRQHQPFTVRFTATNTTSDTIRITTSHGCLVIPAARKPGVEGTLRVR